MKDIFCLPKVSRETQELFDSYKHHLEIWNRSIQLVQKNSLDTFKDRHLDDCLQIAPLMDADEIVDIGSGAGLPGLILAIFFPDKEFTLIESNRKKHEFHLEIIHQLELKNVVTICDRIENIKTPFPIVTSRALANLSLLLDLTKNVSCETTKMVFLKGENVLPEIEEANKKWSFDYKLINSLTLNKGKILIVNNVKVRNE